MLYDQNPYHHYMTSPRKSLQIEKQSTLFSELSHAQKQTSRLQRQLLEDIQNLKRVESQFKLLEKEGKSTGEDFKVKATLDIRNFQAKIKTYLDIQKSQYSRFAEQINQLIATHKGINSHLQVLSARFEQYRKNVGV